MSKSALKKSKPGPGPTRKGARTMRDIPPMILEKLHRGEEEPLTLVEWLAIDHGRLFGHVAADLGLSREAGELAKAAERLAGEGIMSRMRGMGEALAAAMPARTRRDKAIDRMAGHGSGMIRSWAAYGVGASDFPSLSDRLDAMKRFAADRSMAVRECAWDAMRPHLVKDLDHAIQELVPWVHDADPNVRRCATEATRPRGVWTFHISSLKADPSPGLALLEPVKSDSSDYVRRSVANWLNDASKTRADWVGEVVKRWLKESGTRETKWIVNHATRTMRKV